MSSLLSCPVCSEPLLQVARSYRCARGHHFDMAREGYVNLLLQPGRGDTKPMLVARRAFLEKGFYAPVGRALNELLTVALRGQPAPSVILDVGCGEGYFLGGARAHLATQGLAAVALGMDFSKEALRLAARRYPEIQFFAADVWKKIPMQTGTVSCLTDVFAPRNWDEFSRVVAPGGAVLVAVPAAGHLEEVRARFGLLGIGGEKEQELLARSAGAFRLIEKTEVRFDLHLEKPDLLQLLTMTPNFWHLSDAQRAEAESVDELDTGAAVDFYLFRKT